MQLNNVHYESACLLQEEKFIHAFIVLEINGVLSQLQSILDALYRHKHTTKTQLA